MTEDDLRKLDYEHTVALIQQLAEIRFKLLAFLPIATGAALGLAGAGKDPLTGALLGALGFFVTIGIIFYDQRNTEIYEIQVRRAKLLELRLHMPPACHLEAGGGPFMGRPPRARKLFGQIEMWHDRGLAIIYSSALGVWAFLGATSLLLLFPGLPLVAYPGGTAMAYVVVVVAWEQFQRLDGEKSEQMRVLDREIQELTDRTRQ